MPLLRALLAVLACVLALGAAPASAETPPVLECMQERVVEPAGAPRVLFARGPRTGGIWLQSVRTRLRVATGRRAIDGIAPARPCRTARELRDSVTLITHLRLASAGAARVPQPRGPPASSKITR